MLLADIKYNKDNIINWKYKDIGNSVRLFYKTREDKGNGFDFHVVLFSGCDIDDDPSMLTATVEILQHGVAYFDGMRHLNFGMEESDNEGYFYYPNMLRQIKIMRALRDLEVQYCWDHETEMF